MKASGPPKFRGKSLGITILVVAQILIGSAHVFFGFLLLSTPTIYGAYTVIFGSSILSLSYGIWHGTDWGLKGTIAISIFVIIVDSLTVLNLPSIPGIPKIAAFGEISYSLIVTLFLFQKTETRTNTKTK